MPCRGWTPEEIAAERAAKGAPSYDTLVVMLCETIREHVLNEDKLPDHIYSWWEEHRREDEARRKMAARQEAYAERQKLQDALEAAAEQLTTKQLKDLLERLRD